MRKEQSTTPKSRSHKRKHSKSIEGSPELCTESRNHSIPTVLSTTSALPRPPAVHSPQHLSPALTHEASTLPKSRNTSSPKLQAPSTSSPHQPHLTHLALALTLNLGSPFHGLSVPLRPLHEQASPRQGPRDLHMPKPSILARPAIRSALCMCLCM